MVDDAKLRHRRARGQAAERILNDVLVKEAFDAVEQSIYKAWKESAPEATDARHDLYLMNSLFGDFKDYFAEVLKKGNAAAKELLRLEGDTHGRR